MSRSEQAHRLNQRIKSTAANIGMTSKRLRQRIAFQRMLARLSLDPAWVLKGGFSLEMRLGLVARATKDLDVWRLSPPLQTALDLQDIVDAALDADLQDGFTFRISSPRHIDFQDSEPSTWRISIGVLYFGSPFVETTLDIATTQLAAREETDALCIESALIGEPFVIPAVDLNRHGAEKYHAMVRLYSNNRPSTRVKDLVDIVLLIEGEWLNLSKLGAALRRVFMERNGIDPPPSMPPQPPTDWEPTYTRLASETGTTTSRVLEAWAVASDTYEHALQTDDRAGDSP